MRPSLAFAQEQPKVRKLDKLCFAIGWYEIRPFALKALLVCVAWLGIDVPAMTTRFFIGCLLSDAGGVH